MCIRDRPGPEGGYPLYLYMHGSGDKGQEWATGILLCQKFDDVPSAYFIPQIPNMGNYYRWWQKSKQFAWEKLLRLAFVSGNINPDKVYFFGISEGGYGSQRLASYYADYLAGAGPVSYTHLDVYKRQVFASTPPYSGLLFYASGNTVYRLDFKQAGGKATAIYTHAGGKAVKMKFAKRYLSSSHAFDAYEFDVQYSLGIGFDMGNGKGCLLYTSRCV